MYKLLIVDDEHYITDGLYRTFSSLSEFSLEIYRAYCAKQALDYFTRYRMDIIITDINMPIMNGLEMIAEIKNRWPDCRTIILSGYNDFEYAKTAEEKGFKVIIAGAGMAAHLPGMCAALFPMPVIGIPMSGKNLEGMDALYSIVQMPPGIPVATVAIDGGMNAAILAAKMLAMSDPELLEKLKAYSAEMKDTVQAKADRLAEVGYEEYLNNK